MSVYTKIDSAHSVSGHRDRATAPLTSLAKAIATGLIVVLLTPTLAAAQSDESWKDWTLGAPWVIGLEAFHPKIDTKVRLDSITGVPGTPIDLEQNLGMDDTDWLPNLTVHWRFAKKHRFSMGYYELNRSSDSTNPFDIRIGDSVFEATLPMSSFFDVTVVHLLYSYSLVFSEKAEFSVSGGLSLADLHWGYSSNGSAGLIDERDELLAPVPTIAFSGGYAFTDKFFFRGSAGYLPVDFALDDEEDLKGDIATASLGIFHQTFENVRFGLSLQYYKLDIDWGNGAGFDEVSYEYYGPALTIATNF